MFCSSKCSQSSEYLKSKVKKTCNKRYGSNSFLGTEECLKATVDTNKKKYGTEWFSQTEQWKEKTKTTSLNKFGSDHHSKTDQFKTNNSIKTKKRSKTFLNNYLKENNLSISCGMDKYNGAFDKDLKYIQYEFNCDECGNIFNRTFGNGSYPICRKCNPKLKSGKELEIIEFIQTEFKKQNLNYKIVHNYRDGLEIDILIPELGIGFEFNGLIWHSFGKNKWSRLNNTDLELEGKFYHKNKSDFFKKRNIQIFHIFENEWLFNRDLCKSMIKSRLSLISNRIYARKCKVVQLSKAYTDEFLETNHIQGIDSSSVKLGLEHNNEIVSVMTFVKSRYSTKYNWELSRFCSLKQYSVVGGAGKLLKYFKTKFTKSGDSIISYCDLRYGTGKVYTNVGFEYSHTSSPNYFYFLDGDLALKSRLQFQKHKLKNKLKTFDNKLTESQNMFNNGYRRIWDCGNNVYILNVN